MENGAGWKDESLVSTYLEGIKDGMPGRSAQFDVMLRLIKSTGREVGAVLDIGAGDGALASAILKSCPKAKVTLLDFSEPMLAAARARFEAADFNVSISKADISDPLWLKSLNDRSPFDVIVSGYAIHHLEDVRKMALYEEIYSCLAPGAIFINIDRVASLSGWSGKAASEFLTGALRQYHEERGTPKLFEKIEERLKKRDEEKSDILAPVEAQCQWMRKTGFVDVECYFKLFEHALFAGRKMG